MNIKDKPVFNDNGNVAVNNLNAQLMEQVVKNMKKTDGGICVGRQFVYDKEYLMLIINSRSNIEGPESYVEVAIWVNKEDAEYYITRSFVFKRTEFGIRKWEDFCDKVSGSSAVFERDLIGNFFIGHITSVKTRYDNQFFYFENLVVDKFLGHIDPSQVQIMQPKNNTKVVKTYTPKVANLLEDEDED